MDLACRHCYPYRPPPRYRKALAVGIFEGGGSELPMMQGVNTSGGREPDVSWTCWSNAEAVLHLRYGNFFRTRKTIGISDDAGHAAKCRLRTSANGV